MGLNTFEIHIQMNSDFSTFLVLWWLKFKLNNNNF